MSRSDALIESKTLRQVYADRTDVLDKVKKLVMLPDDVNASVELVADYYEVPKKTLEAAIQDNREEVTTDGLRVLTGDELTCLKQVANISNKTRAFTIIPRRAILRIGMLLRDSLVARSVRDYLLDTEASTPKPMNEKEQLKAVMKLSLITSEEIESLKIGFNDVKEKVATLTNKMRIDGAQEYQLRSAGQKKVLDTLGGIGSPAYIAIGRKAFDELWRSFKRHFILPRYSELPLTQFDEGMYFISKWRPSTSLEIEIEQHNNQVQLNLTSINT